MSEKKIDSRTFRAFMRNVPSAITVITAGGESEARGMTAASFVSVSLDPPLVCFNVGRDSRMIDVLRSADYFAVHLLAQDQVHIAEHFALPDLSEEQQFSELATVRAGDGTPILEGTLAAMRCGLEYMMQAGDHDIVIGRVEEILYANDGAPLIYHQRGYRAVGESVGRAEER